VTDKNSKVDTTLTAACK